LLPVTVGFVVVVALACLVSFQLGEAKVRRTTVVRSGYPNYDGVYYGECVWEGVPHFSRQFCATDATRDKAGQPLPKDK
jgi:hypothetical protein